MSPSFQRSVTPSGPLKTADQIHQRALEIATRYKRAEAELIEALQEVDEHRVYLKRGHSSLYDYARTELGLSESVSYTLITVARKAREVPALKAALRSGELTLSNARRIVPVLTRENQSEWIARASALSNRALEKEIIRIRPEEAVQERTSYVTESRLKLELGLSEADLERLKRVQDLLCQSRNKSVSMEETLVAMTQEYLRRHDPVEKAQRCSEKRTAELVTLPVDASPMKESRKVIPSRELHQVNLRDQGRCTYLNPDGTRCRRTRWIHLHHRVPVSRGGRNTAKNLTTLCSAHHRFVHLRVENAR